MAYSKLHSSIVGSSLWTEPDSVRILFITLLAMCDKTGIVYGSRAGLGRMANLEPDEADTAWEVLLAPDPNSSDRIRSPETQGRRVEEVPGGFKLLNFNYYTALRNDDDRREQNRKAQAKFKAKARQSNPSNQEVSTVSHAQPSSAKGETEKDRSAHTDADADADADVQKERRHHFVIPSLDEIRLLMEKSGAPDPAIEADIFFNFYASKGWMVGRNKMSSVARCVGGWCARMRKTTRPAAERPPTDEECIEAARSGGRS